jgi:hypothetical protein
MYIMSCHVACPLVVAIFVLLLRLVLLKWVSNDQKASRYNLGRSASCAISVSAIRVSARQQLSAGRTVHRSQLIGQGTNKVSERSLPRGLSPAVPVTALDVTISYLYRLLLVLFVK